MALKKQSFSRTQLGIFAVIFAVIGGMLIYRSFAATTNIPGIAVVRNGNSYNTGTGYNRYSMITVGVADADAAASLPDVSKKCVYMNAWSVNNSYYTGVSWAEANANGWLLKDTSGNLLVNSGYAGNNILDVRNASARARYIQSVADFVTAHKLNCVFMDDVLAQITTYTGVANANLPTGYSTYTDQEDAIVMFMSDVGPALQSKGIYIYGNTLKFIPGDSNSDNGSLTAAFWRRIGPYMNGMMDENWVQNPNDPTQLRASGSSQWYYNWEGWQSLVSVAQSIGRDFYGETYGDTTNLNAMRYGKVSFMLDWNGRGGAYIWSPGSSNGTSGDYDPWNPEWTTDIGQPSAAKYQVGSGWRRDYTGGTVLINPSSSSSQTFNLGATYKKVDGTSVTSITLNPISAIILTGSNTSTTPGDLNNDTHVNITDLSILLTNYGTTNSTADINKDGTVNITDLSILLTHFGA